MIATHSRPRASRRRLGAGGGRTDAQDRHQSKHGPEHRVAPRRLIHALLDCVGQHIRHHRRREAEQRRRRQVDPQFRRTFPSPAYPLRRHSLFNNSAVIDMPIQVDNTTTSSTRNPNCASRSRCAITPTPTGTNSSDRRPNKASAAMPTGLRTIGRFSAASRISMPMTGPGTRSNKPRATNSPADWHNISHAIPCRKFTILSLAARTWPNGRAPIVQVAVSRGLACGVSRVDAGSDRTRSVNESTCQPSGLILPLT